MNEGATPSPGSGRRPPPSPRHILLADDDPASRELTEAILHQAGYAVSTAGDGPEAWEFLQANSGRAGPARRWWLGPSTG